MIGIQDQHCHTCGGICKCGIYNELPHVVWAFRESGLSKGKFIKTRIFGGNEFPSLRRWASEQGKAAYGQIQRAIQYQIDNPAPHAESMMLHEPWPNHEE